MIRVYPSDQNSQRFLYTPTPTPVPTSTPTATPSGPTATPTPTGTPTPTPMGTGITYNGLITYVDGTSPSYPGSGTVWYDLTTGTTYNGTLVNGPTFTGTSPGFFTFDGVNDYVNFSVSGDTMNEATMGGWFKVPTTGTTGTIFYNTDYYNIKVLSGGFIGAELNSNLEGKIYSYTKVQANVWYYVLLTLSLTPTGSPSYRLIQNIYVNGVLQGSNSDLKSSTFNAKTTGTICRQVYFGTPAYTNASVADFEVYNRILTDTEIYNNFQGKRAYFGV